MRLRWGFREETVRVSWNLGMESTLYDLLRAAIDTESCVEVVLGGTSGFEDRFARSTPFWPTDIGLGWVSGRSARAYAPCRVSFSDITANRSKRYV